VIATRAIVTWVCFHCSSQWQSSVYIRFRYWRLCLRPARTRPTPRLLQLCLQLSLQPRKNGGAVGTSPFLLLFRTPPRSTNLRIRLHGHRLELAAVGVRQVRLPRRRQPTFLHTRAFPGLTPAAETSLGPEGIIRLLVSRRAPPLAMSYVGSAYQDLEAGGRASSPIPSANMKTADFVPLDTQGGKRAK